MAETATEQWILTGHTVPGDNTASTEILEKNKQEDLMQAVSMDAAAA